jgi:hypothetical protein
VAAAREDLVDDLVRLVALDLGVLANELAQLVVRYLDAGLVGDGIECELARDAERRLGAQALLELLRSLVRDGEVGLRRDSAPLERADEPSEELGGARLDERAGGLDLGGGDERVRGGGTELGLDLLLDLLADARLDVTSTFVFCSSESSYSTSFVSPGDMPTSASSSSSTTRPRPSSIT